ncbi:MAG: hypothetical protein ACR2LC_03185 [Pyrinomonadaceae bacterium]
MKSKTLLLFAAICLWSASVFAQGEIEPQLNQRRIELVKALEDSKTSMAQLLIYREANLRAVTKQLDQLKELYAQGQVTKIKLDQAEMLLTTAQNEADKGGVANAPHASFADGVLTPPLTKGNIVPSGLP